MAAKQTDVVDKAAESKAHKAETPKLNAKEAYTVIGTGKNRHLAKGEPYEVSGADAVALIENGHVTLKTTDK